jgi:sortase B
MFPDAVGWLISEGTEINYPIVQAKDNDFYLDHLPDGTKNKNGSIFLDYRNTLDFHGQNIFIYGHDTASDAMFGSLKKYETQSYYEQNKTMRIYTPENNFEVTLFAGYLLDSRYEHPPFTFINENDFNGYIEDIKTRSFFQSNERVSYGDTLVFICTCQEGQRGEARSRRRVIVGKLNYL